MLPNRRPASLTLAFIVLSTISAPHALADTILTTNDNVGAGGYQVANSNGATGIEFTLTGATTIADFVISADDQFGSTSTSNFVMEIYQNATSSSLGTLEYTSGNASTIPDGNPGNITFTFSGGASVSAGTFYAVLIDTNSNDSNGLDWFQSTDSAVSNAHGSITARFYYDSGFQTNQYPMTLQIDTPTTVPEPASIAMVAGGLGLVGLMTIRRRRRVATA